MATTIKLPSFQRTRLQNNTDKPTDFISWIVDDLERTVVQRGGLERVCVRSSVAPGERTATAQEYSAVFDYASRVIENTGNVNSLRYSFLHEHSDGRFDSRAYAFEQLSSIRDSVLGKVFGVEAEIIVDSGKLFLIMQRDKPGLVYRPSALG